MTKPTLTVVGGKAADEPNAEEVEMVARATERMVASLKDPDGLFFVVSVADGDVSVIYSGGKLEASVLAEMVAADMKREAIGL